MKTSLSFIGLGIMGSAMVANLLKNGHPVNAFARRKETVDAAIQLGAKSVSSPREAGESAEVVLLCVSDDAAVEEVVNGAEGILSGNRLPRFIIDCSTISPSQARRLSEIAKQKGVRFVDAPVTGGDIGAKNGTLTVMLGCEEADFSYLEEILLGIGKKIIRTGPVGSGQMTKCVNQIACALSTAALIESFAFAESCGLTMQTTLDIVGSGAGASWSMSTYGSRILNGDLKPGFPIKHMIKDLEIVLREAAELNLPLPLTKQMQALYATLRSMRNGDVGTQALIETYRAREMTS